MLRSFQKTFLTALSISAFSLAAGHAPALARALPAASGNASVVAMSPNCATADAELTTMTKSMSAMAATGDLDRDFMAMSAKESHMMMGAAKLEMACGKKREDREIAEKLEKQERETLRNLMIGIGNTH